MKTRKQKVYSIPLSETFKQTEESLKETSQQLINAVDFLPHPTFVLDNDKKVIIWNKAIEVLTGISRQEIIGKSDHSYLPLWYSDHRLNLMEIVELNDESKLSGFKHIKRDKNTIEAEILIPDPFRGKSAYLFIKGAYLLDNNGNRIGYMETFLDITERKQKEFQLIRTTRILSVLSNVNQAIINIHDKEKLFEEICDISVKYGKFCMAWIGIASSGDEKPVKYFPKESIEDEILYKVNKNIIGDHINENSPAGIAIREGRKVICNNFTSDPVMIPWKDEALKVGYYSSVTIPIKLENNMIGTFTLYAHRPYYFDEEEVKLLTDVTENISFAIKNIDNEKARVRSEDRLKALLSATSDVVYRMSPDWSQMHDLQGGKFLSSVESPIDYWLQNFIPPDSQRMVLAAINRAISTKSMFELEHKVLRVDGSTGWTLSRAIPIFDDKGEVIEWYGIAHDFTDRKNAEIALQQSEERFSKAFHNIPVPATIMRVSDNILTDVNNIFLQLFEYSRDEVINHTSKELNLFFDYNERMKSKEILEKNGYVRDYEIEMLTRAGIKLTLLVSSETIIIQEQKHFLTTYIDITERKESERKLGHFSAIIQDSEAAIVSKDLNGTIQTWNAGAEKIYGYTTEEVMGKNISILFPQEKINEVQKLINRVLQEEKIENYETSRIRKDGTIIPVAVNLSPIKSASGEIIGISSISHDRSELIKAEEALRAKERAEYADRLKSVFLTTISHELRTPLNSLLGFSGILLQEKPGPLNEEQKKQIGMMQSSSRHLLSLVNELLDLTKIEAGELILNFESFKIQELIEDVLKTERHFAQDKGISLEFQASPDVDELISDKKRVRQVVINLVNNAIKFTEKGSVSIVCYKDNHSVKVEVKDTGIGIKNKNIYDLFNPFIQIDNYLNRKHEGSGLGLSICKKLVELLHGTISVTSEFGVGSTFTVTLPFK